MSCAARHAICALVSLAVITWLTSRNMSLFLGRIRDLDDAIDEDARRQDVLGIDRAGSTMRLACTIVVFAAIAISGEKLRAALR
jgi:hypothetical protein